MVRIGWAGGGSHVKDLEFILPAINNILKAHKNVEFHLLGGAPPSFSGNKRIKSQVKWYSIDKYPQAVRDLDLDIAIAPLRDNAFNRGKSNLRWLEYSALKIPTIASNIEPFKCIEDGKTGLLATEVGEWEDMMSFLIKSKDERDRIGQEAYKKVKKDFNVEKWALVYADNIKQMVRGKANISKQMAVLALSGNG